MPTMTEIICKCGCGRKKQVRTADVKRGWGKFFSKSCKAREQEKHTGQYRHFKEREDRRDIYGDEMEFSNAHQFSNEEHDCNKD